MAAVVPIKLSVEGAEQVKSTLSGVGKMLGAAFAADKIKDFVSLGLKEWSQMQGAVGGLTAALGKQSKALLDLSEATARNSTFQQDEIVNGYKRLAMYGLTEEQIAKISPVMQDLAAVTGSQEDAAKMLGQAIQTGGGKLATFGVTVDKTASQQERFNALINGGADAIDGQARAAFDAMNPMDKMNKLWADAAEAVGTALIPTLNELYEFMPDLTEVLSNVTKGVVSAFKFAQLGVQGLVLGVFKALDAIAGAASKLPGIGKWAEDVQVAMKTLTKISEEEIKKTVDSIDKLWAAAEPPATKPKKKGGGLSDTSEDEKANKEAERLAKERADAILLIEREARDMSLDETAKEINALTDKYQEEIKMFEDKEGQKTEVLEENARQRAALEDNLSGNINKVLNKEKAALKKARREKMDAIEEESIKRSDLAGKIALEEQKAANARAAQAKLDKQMAIEGVSTQLGQMANLFEGHAKFIAIYKTMAVAQATMDTYASAVSAYNSAVKTPIVGPVLGPIAAGIAVAAGLVNVQKIATTKFAYGGVATGGTPGVDSVPAMLMPGEVVYNPNNPDPRLLSMINSNAGGSTIHVGGTQVVIQGNVSKGTVAEIGKVTEKALITAMRKAQAMGKINATGMKIRN